MKRLILICTLFISFTASAQFTNRDTLRGYINKWIRNSAVDAFTNMRLNTTLNGMVNFLDSTGAGGSSNNSSVGSGYKLAVPNSRNIKSLGKLYGITLDSSVSGQVNIKADSATLYTFMRGHVSANSHIVQGVSYIAAKGITPVTAENYMVTINNQQGYFKWDSTDNSTADDSAMVIVTSGSKRLKRIVPNETIDVRWFGARGDNANDDYYSLQKAINYAIYNNYKKVYIPSGTYKLSKGLVIWKDANKDSVPEFVNLEIYGAIPTYRGALDNETVLYANNRNGFCLGIQWGKGVTVRNINFTGTNQIDYTNAQAWSSAATYKLDSQRTNKFSPYAGIVMDPFGSNVADSNKYPGFSEYYIKGKGTTGSTDCKFENITVDGFIVGIIMTPNGNTQNNESNQFINVWLKNLRDGFVTCNSQERQTVVRNFRAWYNVRTVFSNKDYGAENGVCPDIDGVNIAGNIFQCFNIVNSFSNVNIKNVYAESLYRIGTVSGFNAVISDSYFDLASMEDHNVKYPDWILNAPKPLSINNSTIYYYNGEFRAPFNILGYVNFDGCLLHQPAGVYYNQWTFPNPNVTYNKCRFYGLSSTREEYIHSYLDYAKNFNAELVKPGYKFLNYSNNETTQFREITSPMVKSITLGSVTVTVSGLTATAVIPRLAKKTFYIGSTVFELNQNSDKGTQLMRISAINDTGLVTFDKIIDRVTTGTYSLFIEKYQMIGYGYQPILYDYNNANTLKFSNMIQEGSTSAFTPSKTTTYYYNAIPVVFDTVVSGGGTQNTSITNLSDNTIKRRGILSNFDYKEWGTSFGNPLTNGYFNDGVLFTEGAIYQNTRKYNADSSVVEYKCIRSGIKGSASPPEFETIYRYNRKMDSAWVVNDTTIRYTINGTQRDLTIKGSGLQYITEGTYSPTKYIVTNADSASFSTCSYQKINNYIYVYGEVYVDPTSSNADTEIDISLPVSATIGSTYQLAGNGSAHAAGEAMRIYGDTANNRAKLRFKSSDNTGHTFSFAFTYRLGSLE